MRLNSPTRTGVASETFPTRPFVGPRRVLAGRGAATELGVELRAAHALPGAGPVVIVVDAAVQELGLADASIASLGPAGFVVGPALVIAGEPTSEEVERFVAAHDETPAAVVGIGGGSAMDAAKLVALASVNELDLRRGLSPAEAVLPGPPVVLTPTTAGTGSEATAVAMLWDDGRKRMFSHQELVASAAILDSDLLATLPSAVTASGGLDAVSHAIESVLSEYRSPLTVAAASAAFSALVRWLPEAYEDGSASSRMATLMAAYQAGLALNASVVVGHSMAYAIAARTGLSHGATCAMALPYCLAYCRPAAADRLARLAIAAGLGGEDDATFRWVAATNDALGIPISLASVGIEAEQLSALAAEVVESYPRPNNPTPVERERLEDLLGFLHRGERELAWTKNAALGGNGGSW